MPEIEAYAAVRDFVETGGDVLLIIAVVTFGMWILILERYWFFSLVHPANASRVQAIWEARVAQTAARSVLPGWVSKKRGRRECPRRSRSTLSRC